MFVISYTFDLRLFRILWHIISRDFPFPNQHVYKSKYHIKPCQFKTHWWCRLIYFFLFQKFLEMAGGDGSARRRQPGIKGFIMRNLLTMLTVTGVVAGTILGCSLRATQNSWTEREVMYLQFPGDLFLRMLKCLIVPLLVSSIVSAIGSLDLSMSGRIGFRAIIYYMTTTICAVVLGIVLVSAIRPGVGAQANGNSKAPASTRNVLTADTLLDLIR